MSDSTSLYPSVVATSRFLMTSLSTAASCDQLPNLQHFATVYARPLVAVTFGTLLALFCLHLLRKRGKVNTRFEKQRLHTQPYVEQPILEEGEPMAPVHKKRLLWDALLCPLLAWLVNLVSVVFALGLNTIQSILCLPRHNVKLCVATTMPPALLHAEATHISHKRRATPTLSPYLSALMVPSALSCTHTRKSLVLDLDETLVHSQFKLTDHCDLRMEVRVDDFPAVFYVSKRPYLDVFLRTVAHWYDVVIFTASLQKYGDPLITVLDVDKVVKRRIFRQDCLRKNGNFVKDLTIVNPNLADVIIVDNSPAAYSIQPSNAIPIQTWYCDQNDEELLNLLPLLHALAFLNDVRSLLDLRLTGGVLVGRKQRNSFQ